ncbi:flagellar basal-body MS-ring/collar protein FliF [Pseudohongiella sp. SYSU M77423]|uniref:flagellar basal-body MS-ring/collar protein FliF n=1 Tax=Pseudohongiella sp. SYSU M77423 TaxID=3042312 RepID=UPI0024800FE5|nr:flagellar basal-body MS-ring/collar protein FliF [Pseudohongiella sp. SYSU M77423]MDH7942973.1 flagellar basal-body MS-ring/collar protein FliF [Pseudohongiella sp. SYSU M77423]
MAAAETSGNAGGTPANNSKSLFGGGSFLSGFNRLNMLRQAGLLLGLAASIALGFSVVLWSQQEEFQPLYPSMQGYNVSELAQVLETSAMEYRIDPASGVLLVPAARVNEVRLQVAAAGISRDDGYGYEFMDQEQGLGTSQFMEANRYKRSLEGELARTIASFRHVQAARVHLATPERSVFIRNARKATASVFLTLNTGARLTEIQVQSIANLVASSVPEMAAEDVTVVDQSGNLLSRRGENRELAIAGEQFEYVRRYEETLSGRISRILMPLLGSGNFTAEVNADIDFTRSEEAAETYNPDSTVLRSEQSMDERRNGGDIIAGIPGALSNQPPAAGVAPEVAVNGVGAATAANGDNSNTRTQATRNYEVDRTISYTSYDPVAVRRLSVAVVVDEPTGEGAQPWAQEDLDRITALVRDAVGFDAERGDSVTVINRAFAQADAMTMESIPMWEQPWFGSVLRQLGAAAFLLIMVFGVLMPTLKRLAAVGSSGNNLPAVAGAQSQGGNGEVRFTEVKPDASSGPKESVTLSGGEDMMLTGPGDSYERQLSAIKGLVAQDPARVAQVVKNWITND